MSVAIISAMQAEIDLLVRSADDLESSEVSGWPLWSGSIGEREVVLARAGLGKVNTAALAAIVWERFHPTLIVFTGVAGGLEPGLGVGDVVIGERTIQHDTGVISAHGLQRYQAGHIPFFNPTDQLGYEPSPGLLRVMRNIVPTVDLRPVLDRIPEIRFGTIVTGDQFLQDEAARDRLFADLGAQAVEMEGAALAQTAAHLGIDHLVVRSLSDLAGRDAVEHFDRFVSEVSANSARLILALLARFKEDNGDLPDGA